MLSQMRKKKLLAIAAICWIAISIPAYAQDELNSPGNIENTIPKMINDQTIVEHNRQQDLYSPVGYWLQYTDDGKQAQSILQVYKGKNGQLEGKIVVPFVNIVDGKKQVPEVVCKKCGKGNENGYQFDYSNYPNNQVQDLKIMWGFIKGGKKEGSDGALYDDGSILDPSNGKVYSCKIQVQENGNKLYVRGYIGFSLFGRTQYWYRIDENQVKQCAKACGLTAEGHYPYTDKNGKMASEKLWEQCSNITLKARDLCAF
ncbi:DUF2147 domain-containing protein [Fastidiosibacter lacustris]|uniref:DUF2147 domain-containing protein n=1 Tax=Fastidiosibacter lacustris TaxID=2056695 RepID=UPI000E34063B|nr:DUF2147 domain-containing protein [Fastidiosibacter lacustris]